MNENLNLVEILKDCPKGTKLYSSMFGEVKFEEINGDNREGRFTIVVFVSNLHFFACFTKEGFYHEGIGECTLFPSKEQRDWSKFTAPWYKKEKFDPKTLQSFDKVICKNEFAIWRCEFFSSYMEGYSYPNVCVSNSYTHCIPYNEDTKHLVGTDDEAPEYYRYWED